jgi:hypothetical protein
MHLAAELCPASAAVGRCVKGSRKLHVLSLSVKAKATPTAKTSSFLQDDEVKV